MTLKEYWKLFEKAYPERRVPSFGVYLSTLCVVSRSDDYYGYTDQANISYPIRFPTVDFHLYDVPELNFIADYIRVEKGHAPFFTGDKVNDEGRYSFYIGINGFTDTHMNNCIEFIVESGGDDDEETIYEIDLTEEEQRDIFKIIDGECKSIWGKTALEILDETKKELIEK